MGWLLHTANHLGLFLLNDPNAASDSRTLERRDQRNAIIFAGNEQFLDRQGGAMRRMTDTDLCGKMEVLKTLLDTWDEENKNHKVRYTD